MQNANTSNSTPPGPLAPSRCRAPPPVRSFFTIQPRCVAPCRTVDIRAGSLSGVDPQAEQSSVRAAESGRGRGKGAPGRGDASGRSGPRRGYLGKRCPHTFLPFSFSKPVLLGQGGDTSVGNASTHFFFVFCFQNRYYSTAAGIPLGKKCLHTFSPVFFFNTGTTTTVRVARLITSRLSRTLGSGSEGALRISDRRLSMITIDFQNSVFEYESYHRRMLLHRQSLCEITRVCIGSKFLRHTTDSPSSIFETSPTSSSFVSFEA